MLQAAKECVLKHTEAFDDALNGSVDMALEVLRANTTAGYTWRGSCPFYEQSDARAALDAFWAPLQVAMRPLQRREDIFMAGNNDVPGRESEVWVCSMGHFMGLFDKPFVGIPPTGRLMFLRYVEFSRVVDELIAESCLHCDVIGFMVQAGHNPLPL